MTTLHQIQTHPEFVEGCFGCKAGTLRFGQVDATRQKKWDQELALYKSAVDAGCQPESTQTAASMAALKWSEKTGEAYSTETKLEHDKKQVLERYAV